MSTSDLIKVYQKNYDDAEVLIPFVQETINDLKSEIEKLLLSKDIIDYYIMLGLRDELCYYERLMDSLLDNKAQAAKKLANLRQRMGDF